MPRLLTLLLPLLVTACATTPEPVAPPPAPAVVEAPPPPQPADVSSPRGAQNLDQGLRAYDNGQYKAARKNLDSALADGLSKADQLTAHKTLAFVACASGQTRPCKEHFRRVLAIDPGFALSRTEAGHPVWGKAFREVKAEKPRPN